MAQSVLAGNFKASSRFVVPTMDTTSANRTSYRQVWIGAFAQPVEWEMLPAQRGGYFIRKRYAGLQFAPGSDEGPHYYWQVDMRDEGKRVMLHEGADDWETFHVAGHPESDFAFRSFANDMRWVAAEPRNHSVCLAANRDQAGPWEKFQLNIVQEG
jgi:hypothetical protein